MWDTDRIDAFGCYEYGPCVLAVIRVDGYLKVLLC